MKPPDLVTLEGPEVVLEPLSLDHVEGLARVAAGARETFALTFVPEGRAGVQAYVEAARAAHAAGEALPFATVSKSLGRVVGSTRFGNLEAWPWPGAQALPRADGVPDAAEIGWTWLDPAVQRTRVNTEQKLLMLTHAFDVWRVHRVSLITDARNARSRAAIERLGAALEGVRRAHFPAADGTIRDSATYSILAVEWPAVRDHLRARLV